MDWEEKKGDNWFHRNRFIDINQEQKYIILIVTLFQEE
jgi:hypothetical protein